MHTYIHAYRCVHTPSHVIVAHIMNIRIHVYMFLQMQLYTCTPSPVRLAGTVSAEEPGVLANAATGRAVWLARRAQG